MTFAIRHTAQGCGCRQFMGTYGYPDSTRLALTPKFATLAEAEAARAATPTKGRTWDTVEITWGLRWYLDAGAPATSDDVPLPYFVDNIASGPYTRRGAKRFASAKAARELLGKHPAARPGFCSLPSGYRVVRFTKIVSKGA